MTRAIRNLTLTLAAGACVLGLAPAAADDADIELLFVQTSEGLEIDAEAGTFRLVEVSPHTLYFSDRPNRLAGHITMDDYLKEWTDAPDDFDDDPPNATLSVTSWAERELARRRRNTQPGHRRGRPDLRLPPD